MLALSGLSFSRSLLSAAAALGFLLPIGFLELAAVVRRRRERAPVLSVEAVAAKPRPPRARRTDLAPEAVAQACEVTAVVCDIANKHDLAEECEPAVFAEITEKFLAHATEAFRKAGAYIESAGGEGVVAIFGFPESDKQHAEKATRKAMALTQAFSDSEESRQIRRAGNHRGARGSQLRNHDHGAGEK